MFAQLNDRQTFFLIALAIGAVTYVIVKVIDALDKRGERFSERFATYKEHEEATPVVPRKPVQIDGLGDVGIVRAETRTPLGPYDRPPFNHPVTGEPLKPIKDNPQA